MFGLKSLKNSNKKLKTLKSSRLIKISKLDAFFVVTRSPKELEKIKHLFKELKILSQKLKICHNEFIFYKLENVGVKVEIEELRNLVKSTKQ